MTRLADWDIQILIFGGLNRHARSTILHPAPTGWSHFSHIFPIETAKNPRSEGNTYCIGPPWPPVNWLASAGRCWGCGSSTMHRSTTGCRRGRCEAAGVMGCILVWSPKWIHGWWLKAFDMLVYDGWLMLNATCSIIFHDSIRHVDSFDV